MNCIKGHGRVTRELMLIPPRRFPLMRKPLLLMVFYHLKVSNLQVMNFGYLELIISMTYKGAIIAIRDIHQHMYLSVEGGGDRYNLVGAMHYSLVGDRALFRVIL